MAAGNIWVRVAFHGPDAALPEEHRRIDIHRAGAILRTRATGKIGDAPVIAALNLDADGQADYDALKTAYAAAADKSEWLHLLEAMFILVDNEDITEAQAKTFLGVV